MFQIFVQPLDFFFGKLALRHIADHHDAAAGVCQGVASGLIPALLAPIGAGELQREALSAGRPRLGPVALLQELPLRVQRHGEAVRTAEHLRVRLIGEHHLALGVHDEDGVGDAQSSAFA